MKRKDESAGARVLEGLDEALQHAKGESVPGMRVHVPRAVDVKSLRNRLGLSQAAFCARFGFELRTLQGWERDARQPTGPARVLLTVIDREPDAVARALEAT